MVVTRYHPYISQYHMIINYFKYEIYPIYKYILGHFSFLKICLCRVKNLIGMQIGKL